MNNNNIYEIVKFLFEDNENNRNVFGEDITKSLNDIVYTIKNNIKKETNNSEEYKKFMEIVKKNYEKIKTQIEEKISKEEFKKYKNAYDRVMIMSNGDIFKEIIGINAINNERIGKNIEEKNKEEIQDLTKMKDLSDELVSIIKNIDTNFIKKFEDIKKRIEDVDNKIYEWISKNDENLQKYEQEEEPLKIFDKDVLPIIWLNNKFIKIMNENTKWYYRKLLKEDLESENIEEKIDNILVKIEEIMKIEESSKFSESYKKWKKDVEELYNICKEKAKGNERLEKLLLNIEGKDILEIAGRMKMIYLDKDIEKANKSELRQNIMKQNKEIANIPKKLNNKDEISTNFNNIKEFIKSKTIGSEWMNDENNKKKYDNMINDMGLNDYKNQIIPITYLTTKLMENINFNINNLLFEGEQQDNNEENTQQNDIEEQKNKIKEKSIQCKKIIDYVNKILQGIDKKESKQFGEEYKKWIGNCGNFIKELRQSEKIEEKIKEINDFDNKDPYEQICLLFNILETIMKETENESNNIEINENLNINVFLNNLDKRIKKIL